MRAMYSKGLDSYGSVQVRTGAMTANSVQLIQMLFDGLLESVSVAKGHILRKEVAEKSRVFTRAGRIVIGLQGALNIEAGGDLAKNLNELYSYLTRRLIHANIHNDIETLDEISSLVHEVRNAWSTLPEMLRESSPNVHLLRC